MKRLFAGGTCMAVAVASGMTVFAQAGQAPAQPQAQPTARQERPAAESVTIAGCIQREADYRKAQNLGRGGAVGTGAGVGNEFVLVNATTGPASASPTGTAGSTAPGSTGQAYELTGKNEGQVEQFVGRRVEIVGTLKPAETTGAAPTGGPTAGAPPRGVDVASSDLKLRELEITSVREATGTCPTTAR